MYKQHAIYIILIALLLSCKDTKTSTADTTSPQQPPNIVLIMADDQGWGDLSHHKNTNINTPNIDALAKNGVSFTNFYVQPVCSPTRAELLTGLHFTRLGIHGTSAGGERMNLGATTLAESLKEAGYATAAYGKWHNGMQAPYHPNARGFDDYYGFTSGHWGNYFSPMLEHNGAIVKGDGFLVDDLTNHGMEFMAQHKEKPFFLYLPLNTPHSPMQVPEAYWERFKDKDLTMPYADSDSEDQEFTKAALAMVENIDWNVGRITKQLQTLGLEENTIVIYLSDNGPAGYRWNGRMRGKKGSTDEGGVKTPFFVQWKSKLTAGKEIPQIASALDITPTLLELTGVASAPKNIDGKSLAPLITQDQAAWEDRYVYNHWNGKTSIRNQTYRLDDEERLYDMANDLGQTTDVSERFPEVKTQLVNAKNKWLTDITPMTKETDDRPFTLGHPDYKYTQIPARDGISHGTITRSNRHPNNTFFTTWSSEKDSITWDIDVLSKGNYEVTLYYTLPEDATGLTLILNHGNSKLSKQLTEAHDPPLTGMELDKSPRIESYVKDFIPVTLGNIALEKGRKPMVLTASQLKGNKGPDIRLLLFKRVE